ncbi:beta propeller repeat protein [Nocardioides terrisoli]|uniref:hypothetical protein n=1 Tax=Nocardioides terrisoli TaxID=3388267 RepID=UPI00287B8EDD|nr:hypothetical protein [Nocardioides marmorisolisilvae]
MPDFPDLVTPATRATKPPPFESLVARARVRRRTRVATTLTLVVVAVVAIAAGSALAGRHATTRPITPPTPSPDARTAAIVRTGSLVSYAAAPDGSVLTVWQRCARGDAHCAAAWRLTTRAGSWSGLAHGSEPFAYAAGNAFVVTSWDRLGDVVDNDGTARPLRHVRSLVPARGDVTVRSAKGLLLLDPRTAAVAELPLPPGADALAEATVDVDGTVYALPAFAGPGKVWVARFRDRHWTHVVLSHGGARGTMPGYVVASGSHAAALSSFDGATILPVGVLGVTADGGDTWTMLTKSALPFGAVDSMAATSGGTLYLTTPDGEVYRSAEPNWTRFERVAAPRRTGELQGVGDQVVARIGTAKHPRLIVFDDSGWHPWPAALR